MMWVCSFTLLFLFLCINKHIIHYFLVQQKLSRILLVWIAWVANGCIIPPPPLLLEEGPADEAKGDKFILVKVGMQKTPTLRILYL